MVDSLLVKIGVFMDCLIVIFCGLKLMCKFLIEGFCCVGVFGVWFKFEEFEICIGIGLCCLVVFLFECVVVLKCV